MTESNDPNELTIATYPWATIDARDLLRRVAEADDKLEEQRKMAQGIIDEHSARITELHGGRTLDYNDMCDIAFGRIRRLMGEKPEIYSLSDAGDLVGLGLDVKGLGLSGEQVQMAFDVAKALYEATHDLMEDDVEGDDGGEA